jgi:hypothetical protein
MQQTDRQSQQHTPDNQGLRLCLRPGRTWGEGSWAELPVASGTPLDWRHQGGQGMTTVGCPEVPVVAID